MTKVGRFVTDPKVGVYCQITLDSGEKIMINHSKGGFEGGILTLETVKWWGLGSDTVFTCDLDSPGGKAVMGELLTGAPEVVARATPLGAFVDYVKNCRSTVDVRAKCAALSRLVE